MLYKPFKIAQDFESLIHLGKTPECIHWDYKQSFNPKDPADIAIDLAAFANTYGGTLLIGVAEKKINGLKVASSFVPNVDVEEIKKQVHTRIHEIISPKIDVQVVPIEVLGNPIVAVNVEPSINLVGVCLDRDRRQYSFPYRTEYGNQYMIFEEVEKRMVDNKTRAMYLKLKKYLPSGGRVTLYPVPIRNYRSQWSFDWMDGFDNEIKLETNGFRSIIVPISFIDEIWRGHEGVCLKMNTRLYCNPKFIDFENSEKMVIYETNLKSITEAQRFLSEARNRTK
jgi:hypothetical protein